MGLAQIRLFVAYSMVLCLLLAFTFVSGEGYSEDKLGVQSLRDSSSANIVINPNENLQSFFSDVLDVLKHFYQKIIHFFTNSNNHHDDKKPPTLRSVNLDQFLETLRQKRSYQKFVNKFVQPAVQRP